MAWSAEMVDWVRARALGAGFDLAGVAAACGPDEAPLTAERFTEWIAAGRAGEMEYLKRRDDQGELLRQAVRTAIPWAQSVVVCAMNYNAAGPVSLAAADAGAGWIARYAWNDVDYHDDMLARLRIVEAGLRERAGCETKCYVDTGPVLERDLAAKAGIGWVGKNTCVLNEKMGSWLLLGIVVTSLPLGEVAVELAPDRCGSCTRCIDACPTDALVAPREMDASLCIAYLTIEKKGTIAEELREPMGRQVFGCDICQEVCPWNRRAPIALQPGLMTRSERVNPDLGWLGAMDAPEFKRRFAGSPVERTKRGRLLRNVAIAMGNSGEGRFVPQLREWRDGEDAVLSEAASWALERLGG
jgi:epoxyqueuosine reductase